MHFRNNLFLGRDTPGRGIMTLGQRDRRVTARTTTASARTKGVAEQYAWLGPTAGQRLYEPKPERLEDLSPRWPTFRAATGQEAHGIEVDFDIFESLAPPDPANRHAVYHADGPELSAEAGRSKAVDAGVAIPTVNDGFAGRAPDLGALEVGKPQPRYGPRWLEGQPFYR